MHAPDLPPIGGVSVRVRVRIRVRVRVPRQRGKGNPVSAVNLAR